MQNTLTDTPCQSPGPARFTPEWRRDFIMNAVATAARLTGIGFCGPKPPPEAEYLKMVESQSRYVAALARTLVNVADEIADSEGADISAPSPTDCLQGSQPGGDSQ